MGIIIDGTTGIDLGHTPVNNGTNYEVEGNLNITGAGSRITGDFSNATASSKTVFQTSSADTYTSLEVIPSGTGNISAINFSNKSDINNASFTQMSCNDTSMVIRSSRRGTGNYLPIMFNTGGIDNRMIIDTSGNLLLNSGTGALGYGAGSGGTVTQATSKSTAVTLNKPTGQIIMNGAALAGGAIVTFQLNNNLLAINDNLIVSQHWGNENYRLQTQDVGNGFAKIQLENRTGASQSETVIVYFSVIKGANS